ncbi:MAG: hypothetical protein N4A70_19395 [Pelagimonas sp.]|nr:hypothetical protein [Pelagimonas sp.]
MTQDQPIGAVQLELAKGIAFVGIDAWLVGVAPQETAAQVIAAIAEAANTSEFIVLQLRPGGALGLWDRARSGETQALAEICTAVEEAAIPVLVVIEGELSGGETALALCAHYRLAQRGAVMCSPAVESLTVPAGGVTQRLPRLLQGELLHDALLHGTPLQLDRLADQPLVDGVFEGDARDAAVKFVRMLQESEAPPRPVYERAECLRRAAFPETQQDLSDVQQEIQHLIQAAAVMPFEMGCAMEDAAQEALFDRPDAQALRHLQKAELALRQSNAVKALPPDRRIAVLGASSHAMQIVMLALRSGFAVNWGAEDLSALAEWRDQMQAIPGLVVHSGPTDMALLDRLRTGRCAQMVEDADVVLHGESDFLPQALALKLPSIGFLPKSNKRVALLFAHPVAGRGMVELLRGAKSHPGDAAAALALAKAFGKQVLQVGSVRESLRSHLLRAYHLAADGIVSLGADPYQVDAAAEAAGWSKPPFRTRDTLGLAHFSDNTGEGQNWSGLLVQNTRTGWIKGAGFYDWRDETVMPSDQVRALIDAQRAAKTLPPDQIADLLLTAVLNEALELYKKGFVPRVSDLDLATVQALGFPADQGGVIFAAQRRGLFALRSRMAHIVGPDHRFWRPHRLWRRAAEAGADLYDLPRFPTSLERRAARRSRMRQQAAG